MVLPCPTTGTTAAPAGKVRAYAAAAEAKAESSAELPVCRLCSKTPPGFRIRRQSDRKASE
eukprot:scaffold921_cov101-Isochrysis_galbana.AAC.10